MIKSFKHKGLKLSFENSDSRLLDSRQTERIRRLLDALDSNEQLEISYRGNHLHELKGSRQGVWSVRVSGNWRITFRMESNDVYDVDLEDYH